MRRRWPQWPRQWSWRHRGTRRAATLLVTALCVAYIAWKIDLGQTVDVIGDANIGYLVAAVAIMGLSVWPMAWRWQRLLRAREIDDRVSWLTRTYFVSYTAAQVLPTALGGDAARIYETTRRHPGRGGPVAASVLLERALGGSATLVLAAIGFGLALGEYDIGAYVWIELAFLGAAILLGLAAFSRTARRWLARSVPVLRRLGVERPIRAVYEGLHAYRNHARTLLAMAALTLAIQAVRVLAIWLTGEAVGIDLPPRPYYVMGPLLFLVMLVPFTINGLAAREAFFVSFLGQLGVSADQAFAAGFLFFVVGLVLALPGAAILAWESLRRPRSRGVEPERTN